MIEELDKLLNKLYSFALKTGLTHNQIVIVASAVAILLYIGMIVLAVVVMIEVVY